MYEYASICVCAQTAVVFVCVCVHRAIDKLSVVSLSLSDRILMLIPMVNSPETFHRKLIRPLSIIYTAPAFGHTHTHTYIQSRNTVCECDSC